MDRSHVAMLESALQKYDTDAEGLLKLTEKALENVGNREQVKVVMYLKVLAKKRIAGEI
jgi:hypothetical protein